MKISQIVLNVHIRHITGLKCFNSILWIFTFENEDGQLRHPDSPVGDKADKKGRFALWLCFWKFALSRASCMRFCLGLGKFQWLQPNKVGLWFSLNQINETFDTLWLTCPDALNYTHLVIPTKEKQQGCNKLINLSIIVNRFNHLGHLSGKNANQSLFSAYQNFRFCWVCYFLTFGMWFAEISLFPVVQHYFQWDFEWHFEEPEVKKDFSILQHLHWNDQKTPFKVICNTFT